MADEHSNSSRSSSDTSRSQGSVRERSRSESKGKRNRKNRKNQKQQRKGNQKHAVQFPPLEQPLLDFDQFQELYSNMDLAPERLRNYYQIYERKWESRQKELFFEQHKDEQWIQDKYNPDYRKIYFEERCSIARQRFEEFVKQYNMGALNSINLTVTEPQLGELFELNDAYYNDEKETPFWEFPIKEHVDLSKPPFFVNDPNQHSLFIKNVPLELSRQEITQVLQKLPGYCGLTLSEPNKLQNQNRMGWVSFETEDCCQNVLDSDIQVLSHKLNFQRQQEKKKFVRVFKSVDSSRLTKDLAMQRELIKCLDKEKGINGNPLAEGPLSDKDAPTFNRQLDLQTLYLRRVHSFCYWSSAEFSDQRLLVSKVGYHFLRLDVQRPCNMKWQEIIHALSEVRIAGTFEELNVTELVDQELVEQGLKSKQQRKDVYPCQFCDKQFQAPGFVLKHISLKHQRIYSEQQTQLAPTVKEKQMVHYHKQERLAKSTIQRAVFQNNSIDKAEMIDKKLTLPLNFAPRVQQRTYKDLDNIAQEKTQPNIFTQKIKEPNINYNDI